MHRHPQRSSKPRLLVFIAADNAADAINAVLRRIPRTLPELYDIQALVIADASLNSGFANSAFAASRAAGQAEGLPFPMRVLFNPANQGYGGNQKLGYHYAIQNGFDFVALLHGGGQYAPERLPDLLEPLRRGHADAVFGSRMMAGRNAPHGGMPLYEFAGNRILTWIENRLLHTNLSEFHGGYRIYAVTALRAIPFERNSNGFEFDTEIAIQLLIARRPIKHCPVSPYSGGEMGRGHRIAYAAKAMIAAFQARLQELSLFYDRRFDCAPPETYSPYTSKLTYASPHTLALERVKAGSRVLDLGCAGGYLGSRLREAKQCLVKGMDRKPVPRGILDEFVLCDLNAGVPDIDAGRYDVVLMLDVIEHLNRPEMFLEDLRRILALNPSLEFMISTANVACLVTRVMLLLGQFNYGPRGILDVTHTRLFTFASLRRALMQSGFDILETKGIPAPYPLAFGDNFMSRALLALNQMFIRLSRGLFSYQIFMRVKPQPSLELLLAAAEYQWREPMACTVQDTRFYQ